MKIRQATVEDIPSLTGLLQQEVVHQTEISSFWSPLPRVNWTNVIRTKLANIHEQLFTAELDEQLVGYIDVRVLRPSPSTFIGIIRSRLQRRRSARIMKPSQNVGWIEDCYVKPEVRLQGIGGALVKVGIEWLVARKVSRVELAVAAANGGGVTFWEHHGFSPLRFLMVKKVN